ncbi:MAG: hypothetical protein H6Q17_248 [Bacteroidetes bacterium]|nr:hypothetical protein [Bacteroidota bacterium]
MGLLINRICIVGENLSFNDKTGPNIDLFHDWSIDKHAV